MAMTYPFSLRQLQYALAVADLLSFRRASERCHVSQPALSAQVAELEGALGLRLFERDRRRVLVTAAGREVLQRARGVVRAADDVVEQARACADPLAGTLRLGVIPTISPYLLPRAARLLRREYPRLSLVWVEDKTHVLARALQEGGLDGALLALEAEVGEVEHAVIARDPFLLAVPAGHPLARARGPAAAADLRKGKVLLLDEGHCFREQALAFCSQARASEQPYRATSLSTLGQMVASGLGLTLLPRLAVATEAARAEVAVRSFAEPAPFRTLALAWRPRSPLGPALRRLAATMARAYPKP